MSIKQNGESFSCTNKRGPERIRLHFTLTLAYLSSGRLPPFARSSCHRPGEGSQAVRLPEERDPYWNRCHGRLMSLRGSVGHCAGKCGSALLCRC